MRVFDWVLRSYPQNGGVFNEVSRSFVTHFSGNGVVDDPDAFLRTGAYTVHKSQVADLNHINPEHCSGCGEIEQSQGWMPILFFARLAQRMGEVHGQMVSTRVCRFVTDEGRPVELTDWSMLQSELLRIGFSEADVAEAKTAAKTIGFVEQFVHLDELAFDECSLFF
jgi:hypothetical protein